MNTPITLNLSTTCPSPKSTLSCSNLGDGAKDPESEAANWGITGAPSGILHQPSDPGIFPDVTCPAELRPEELHADHSTFQNYPGVEEHVTTETEITGHMKPHHLDAFDSHEALSEYLGATPIYSKLGLIIRIRNGIEKARLILDTKESGIKRITAKTQRVILPRLMDAIMILLAMLSLCTQAGAQISAFVLDFSNAFWQIPIRHDERRFFCCQTIIGGERKFLSFNRAAQGSANAPLLWSRVISLVCRLTQALFPPEMLRLMCYVDDPLAVLRGTPEERNIMTAIIILVWEALGFGLAYPKGQLAQKVTWIGGTLEIHSDSITAVVKQSIISDICDDLHKSPDPTCYRERFSTP